MARYFDRLAKRTGLFAARRTRAPAAQDDLVEVNEETVAPTPAETPRAATEAIEPHVSRDVSESGAAPQQSHAVPPITPAHPSVTAAAPVVQRKADGARPAAAATPPETRGAAPLPAPAQRAVTVERTTTAIGPTEPGSPTPQAAATPSHTLRAAAGGPSRMRPHEPDRPATRIATGVRSTTPAVPLDNIPCTDAVLDEPSTMPGIASLGSTPPVSPPRARSIASAPASPPQSASSVEHIDRTGTRVHIGRIDIAIHAPPPAAPPPPPLFAAPRAAERAREPAFSPSRHYLRG